MTKKNLLLLILVLFATACTTTPETAQPPEVVDKSDSAETTDDGGADDTAAGSEAQAFGAQGERASVLQQLEDPESLLSKRIIYFDYDSSTVPSRFDEIIQAHAGFLQANSDLITTLEGHADERGSREYNLALGEQRAVAVKKQLVVLGASPDQIRTVSYGEERPADPAHDEQAWELNRRVEFVY